MFAIWIPGTVFSACSHLPVWELLFGQTLSRFCWQRRSSLGRSWFFCILHKRAKTVCSPHCTLISGTPGKLSVRLKITEESKCKANVYIIQKLYIQSKREYHLYSWGLCPQTHSKSQHRPVDPWESNTIYPWKEHWDLSLEQLSGHSTAQTSCKWQWQAKLLIIINCDVSC